MYDILNDDILEARERLELEAWASASTLPDESIGQLLRFMVQAWRDVLEALPQGVHRRSAWVGFLGGLAAIEKWSPDAPEEGSASS